jgi:prevent-host-death family protein
MAPRIRDQHKAWSREAPAMTVRQNLGDLLSEVQYRKGKVIITKAGKPVAALVDIALFERIRKLDEEFDQMQEELAHAFADVPAKQVEALVDEAGKEARARRRKSSICIRLRSEPRAIPRRTPRSLRRSSPPAPMRS